jgi:putative membrane protein
MFGDTFRGGGPIRQLVRGLFGQGIAPVQKIAMAVAAVAGFLVLTRVFSVGWALVRLHGFTLRRSGDDLRIDFGLFTRVAATIPLRRIQRVTILEGPLHRPFRRMSVHVDTAGGEQGADVQLQRQWLAPVIARDAVTELLREILPSVPMDAIAWRPVDPRGVRRARRAWLVLNGIVCVLTVAFLEWATVILFGVLLGIGELNARKGVRALGWSISDSGVFFRSGWLWRRRTVAPFPKVQAVSVHETPFDRRLGMASVKVDTAGRGEQGHQISVPYLARTTADAIAADVAAQAARTTFRW